MTGTRPGTALREAVCAVAALGRCASRRTWARVRTAHRVASGVHIGAVRARRLLLLLLRLRLFRGLSGGLPARLRSRLLRCNTSGRLRRDIVGNRLGLLRIVEGL